MPARFLKTLLPILAMTIACVVAGTAQAQIPPTLNYQGYLTNSAGQPVNASVNVTFRLYKEASGGAAVWTETQNGTGASNGVFNVVLGSSSALSLPFNVPYFLSLQVNTDAEMALRQPLSAVPYAQRAVTAEALAASATVASSQITGTIAGSQLAATQLLPTTPCSTNQIPQWNGNVWVCSAGTAGPAGPAGPQGLQGLSGPAGPQGPVGTNLTLAQLQGMFVQSSTVQAPQATALMTADTRVGVGSYSSLTIGADGFPVISYYDITNGDLKVTKCGNASCSAGNTVTLVDSVGNVGQYTSIAIGADGMPVISYYDVTNGDLKVARCGNAACSAGNTMTAMDTAGDVGQYTSIAIGADGLPVIAYYDITNGDLKVAKCGNTSCPADSTVTPVDTVGDVGQYASIAIGADGLPVISYRIIALDVNIRVAKCGNAACSAGNTFKFINTGRTQQKPSSMIIGADGLPIILHVHADAAATSIDAIKCDNAVCSATNISTRLDSFVDSAATRETPIRGISMANAADGLPVISYMFTDKLKVAKCGNLACSSGNASNIVDTAGITGGYSSISIGIDGLPVISYFDSSSATLKVAKCANAFCVAAFRQR